MLDPTLLTVILIIGLALAFDFVNGFHDAANSIATVVSTRVLTPLQGVAWAAFFNFVAFLFFGLHVAETVGRGIVEADVVNSHVIFGALAGAIVWQVLTQGWESRRRARMRLSEAWSAPASPRRASPRRNSRRTAIRANSPASRSPASTPRSSCPSRRA